MEMLTLRKLTSFNVTFNRFTSVPETLARLTNMRYTHVEELQMAGNALGQCESGSALTLEIINVLEQVRRIDLRFNSLVSLVDAAAMAAATSDGSSEEQIEIIHPLPLANLQYCTYLDLAFNKLENLDLREMKSLETLNVNNNNLKTLCLNGTLLKNLNASYNKLEYLSCQPSPDFLEKLDVSRNAFIDIPTCFHNCPFLVSANYGHNSIASIPGRYLFNNRRLRSLRVHCNAISSLDEKLFEDLVYVEELYLQSNAIAQLPDQLFNRAVKLKVLNLSRNRLRNLPRPLASLGDISRLQALYLTANQLTDDIFSSLIAFPRLKFLHLARNRLASLDGAVLRQMEFLQDLNVAENLLTSLPNELSCLTKLQTLRAHNNSLIKVVDTYLPESLQVLDLSCNRLTGHILDIFPRNPFHLSELDLSGNPGLHIGDGEFVASLNDQLQIMTVDEPSSSRFGGTAGSNIRGGSGQKSHNIKSTSFSVLLASARTAGSRNKPSVSAKIVQENFRMNQNESFAALFDGGLSNEVPKLLESNVPEILEEECEGRSSSLLLQSDGGHMKRTFLGAHRELKAVGQRLGASSAICHFVAPGIDSSMNKLRLFVGNVGDIEVLICFRDGSYRVLTENYRVENNSEDIARALGEGCVITDNCKINGVSDTTRLLGCGYLFPSVIPSPNVTVFDLDCNGGRIGGNNGSKGSNSVIVVMGNKNLWRFMNYADVSIEVTRNSVESPQQAAKRLLDLAQCFGATENIGIVVGQINFPDVPHSSMSPMDNPVLAVKPWTKERQNRKMAELDGNPLTEDARTSTTASLKKSCAAPLPPAHSFDHFNQHTAVITPHQRNNVKNSLSNVVDGKRMVVVARNGKPPNGSRMGSGDETASTCTTENSADTVRTAVWVPTAVIHQYGTVSGASHHQRPSLPKQPAKDAEPQALSIRVDAADNPRKPRQAPPAQPIQSNATQNSHFATISVNSLTSSSATSGSKEPIKTPSKEVSPNKDIKSDDVKEQPVKEEIKQEIIVDDIGVEIQELDAREDIVVKPAPGQESAEGQSPISDGSSVNTDGKEEVVKEEIHEEKSEEVAGKQDATDESINSAVDNILLPPPAGYGDYEFVSYL